MDYRDDDERGTGWCPRCPRKLSPLDVAGFGYCEEHGRVAANYAPQAFDVSNLSFAPVLPGDDWEIVSVGHDPEETPEEGA